MKASVRIGAGAGFAGDRIEPAVELARHGRLDYLVFECLAERTIALAVRERQLDASAGYDALLEQRMRAVLPEVAHSGCRIISNMGAANPMAAARRTAALAAELGLHDLRICTVLGDDVTDVVRQRPEVLHDMPGQARTPEPTLISANAYLGCEALVEALRGGADIVLTGRVADPALFLAPLVFEFGWSLDDWQRLGRGTVVGHLLECAGQVTGGYFADPGLNDVPGLARLGFPIAEVLADGSAQISKLPGSGGRVCVAGCTEQLLYELHDPGRYLTPDVTADFSSVRFETLGPDVVGISGGGGGPRPTHLKVSIGVDEGFMGEGQITYAGPGAVARGRLALAILGERIKVHADAIQELRAELIGIESVSPEYGRRCAEPPEVRARLAARVRDPRIAQCLGREVEALYTNGPAGGGGVTTLVRPVVAIESALIARHEVTTRLHWETVP